MAYQYPEAPATVGSDLTTLQVHHLMKSPALLVKRAADLARQKFIADFLLTGRYQAVGGAILYETGEEIFPADVAEKIAPGGEYPRTTMTSGELAAAKVEKWGQDSSVTDEAISRLNVSQVDKALRKVVNGMIRQGEVPPSASSPRRSPSPRRRPPPGPVPARPTRSSTPSSPCRRSTRR